MQVNAETATNDRILRAVNLFSLISDTFSEMNMLLKHARTIIADLISAEGVFFHIPKNEDQKLDSVGINFASLTRHPRLHHAIKQVMKTGRPYKWTAKLIQDNESITPHEILLLPMIAGVNTQGVCLITLPRIRSQIDNQCIMTLPGMLRWLQLMIDNIGLQRSAMLDSLTGLWNRRYYEFAISEAFSNRDRYIREFTLVLLDLDHFKTVNDTYGHQAGDLVLRRTSDTIRRVIRKGDIACRIGGEEFALILSNTKSGQGLILAERLRTALSKLEIKLQKASLHVTASFGIASTREHATEAESLFRAADAALYNAKRAGRNKTVIAQAVTEKGHSPCDDLQSPFRGKAFCL